MKAQYSVGDIFVVTPPGVRTERLRLVTKVNYNHLILQYFDPKLGWLEYEQKLSFIASVIGHHTWKHFPVAKEKT